MSELFIAVDARCDGACVEETEPGVSPSVEVIRGYIVRYKSV